MSFYLAQGYLQITAKEDDVPKLLLELGYPDIMNLPRCPLDSQILALHFVTKKKQNVPRQQAFIALLLYLDDIRIFEASIDKMLDRIGLVF